MRMSASLFLQRVAKDDEPEYLIELMAKNLSQVLVANGHKLFEDIEDSNEILRRSTAIYSEIMNKFYGRG